MRAVVEALEDGWISKAGVKFFSSEVCLVLAHPNWSPNKIVRKRVEVISLILFIR